MPDLWITKSALQTVVAIRFLYFGRQGNRADKCSCYNGLFGMANMSKMGEGSQGRGYPSTLLSFMLKLKGKDCLYRVVPTGIKNR